MEKIPKCSWLFALSGTFAAGTHTSPKCTPRWAPPEVVLAMLQHRYITVQPSHDMFALGVVVWEAVTQKPAFASRDMCYACTVGDALYPWERDVRQQPEAWQQSRLAELVMPCLARSAAQRPSALDMLAALSRYSSSALHQNILRQAAFTRTYFVNARCALL